MDYTILYLDTKLRVRYIISSGHMDEVYEIRRGQQFLNTLFALNNMYNHRDSLYADLSANDHSDPKIFLFTMIYVIILHS